MVKDMGKEKNIMMVENLNLKEYIIMEKYGMV